jgi:hypothetical protein
MSFTSNLSQEGCRFEFFDDDFSNYNASPIEKRQLVIDMFDTPRRSSRQLQEHLEETIGTSTPRPDTSRGRPRIRIPLRQKEVSRRGLSQKEVSGRVLRSGTRCLPLSQKTASRKKTGSRTKTASRKKSASRETTADPGDGSLAFANMSVAAASANPLQSTLAQSDEEEEEEQEEMTMHDREWEQKEDDDQKMSSISEKRKESSSSGSSVHTDCIRSSCRKMVLASSGTSLMDRIPGLGISEVNHENVVR